MGLESEGALHIALSATDPDLADQEVLLLALTGDLKGTGGETCLHWLECGDPLALCVGSGARLVVAEGRQEG